MEIEGKIRQVVGDVIAARSGIRPRNLELERKVFGGTEAVETSLVTARYRDPRDRAATMRTVVKRLEGRPAREAAVYETLVANHAPEIAPELLATRRQGPDGAIILLEAVRKTRAWPWGDAAVTSGMLTQLGRFHTSVRSNEVRLPEWDFEHELVTMGNSAYTVLDQNRYNPEIGSLARNLRVIRRVIEALPGLRRQLLNEQPFGCRPIHGDVHPGNALVRRRRGQDHPVLIDWGRARMGSPLEDVSSWLQTLRFWEFEAQRLHDTYFRRYLSAFGMPRKLTDDVRAAYWIAGASNALAGALIYHLSVILDPKQPRANRKTSYYVALDWLRIIRRAHAWTM
ncbi:aminoglycoside phosphotransferase family protein [Chelativorans sp. YIM 93263]|uniref:aminoglycoside phosphotransferase family protein n=1 Tax=Chelativorans sp. YIM 93263 TaxID=2906648 RepID=UPI002379D7AC|nr:aminoglycoside phosphotransferase family protein [Chelativorans sp. YIM 93263]